MHNALNCVHVQEIWGLVGHAHTGQSAGRGGRGRAGVPLRASVLIWGSETCLFVFLGFPPWAEIFRLHRVGF